jgi:hypothetical protein
MIVPASEGEESRKQVHLESRYKVMAARGGLWCGEEEQVYCELWSRQH